MTKVYQHIRTDELCHIELVGGIPTPLKNMSSSVGSIRPN
jgi:hypothetical protein